MQHTVITGLLAAVIASAAREQTTVLIDEEFNAPAGPLTADTTEVTSATVASTNFLPWTDDCGRNKRPLGGYDSGEEGRL